jgi:hypothetical protein
MLIYTLTCGGIGFAAFTLIHQHVTTHRVPSAFGLEYLVVLLPFLVASVSFPFLPLITYIISNFTFRSAQFRLVSSPILTASVLAYSLGLAATGFFFTWARQQ